MAADRVIKCTNQDGDVISFTERYFTPFILVKVEGVYDSVNDINILENTMTDGGIYQGSTTKPRNIVITVKDLGKDEPISDYDVSIYSAIIHGKTLDILDSYEATPNEQTDDIYVSEAGIKGKTLDILAASPMVKPSGGKRFSNHRALLDKIFKKGELGHLSFTEGGKEKVIDYYVESVKTAGKDKPDVRYHVISLICPDPYFYDPDDIHVMLAQIIPNFQFIHEFSADGEEFGYSRGVYENIFNETANENIGLTIVMSGDVDIVNPIIRHMNKDEFIQIGDRDNRFTLYVGYTLIITTGVGNKHVYLVDRLGTRTEINYYMAEGSTFIQLGRGNNNIAYDAEEGKNGMTLDISYRLQYARA